MSNIVKLGPPPLPGMEASLEMLDRLRERVAAGEVMAFIGVSVGHDLNCEHWSLTTKPVSRLILMGAMSHLEHVFHHE